MGDQHDRRVSDGFGCGFLGGFLGDNLAGGCLGRCLFASLSGLFCRLLCPQCVSARGRGHPVSLRMSRMGGVIFKRVGAGRPYPDHGLGQRQWAEISPTQVHLDELVTTNTNLDLERLLDEDSTYFGDLFAHVVQWKGDLYLEDGLHRAVRAALQHRHMLHARVHVIGKHT